MFQIVQASSETDGGGNDRDQDDTPSDGESSGEQTGGDGSNSEDPGRRSSGSGNPTLWLMLLMLAGFRRLYAR